MSLSGRASERKSTCSTWIELKDVPVRRASELSPLVVGVRHAAQHDVDKHEAQVLMTSCSTSSHLKVDRNLPETCKLLNGAPR